MKQLGTPVDASVIENFFIVQEGEGNILIGKIRQGKSYGASMMIIDLLERGNTVYATWPVHTLNIDDRESMFFILRGLIFPWKKRYFVIPTFENFHYINAETGEVDGVPTFEPTTKGYIRYLNSINHAHLFIDEAWRILNHTLVAKSDMEDVFNMILVTGHKFRTVNVISQRLVGINPTFRDNANRVYRFTKKNFLFWTRFTREEFQDWQGDFISPDQKPEEVISYFGRKKIFDAYNSWYYGDLEPLHELKYRAFDLTYWQRLIALYRNVISYFPHLSAFFKKKIPW